MKQGNRSSVWNTCSNEYTLLRLLFIPKRWVSDIFNHLITSIMEYIALCASLFLKNALISERKFVTLCTGIGLSFLLFCHYKDTHFLQQTEIPMPFLCTNTSYYCQLAKLEFMIIRLDWWILYWGGLVLWIQKRRKRFGFLHMCIVLTTQ